MLKCGLCGKEFEDEMFEAYAAHVQECAKARAEEQKKKDLERMNAELEEVKRAKIVYEGLRDAFKEKYPEAYKMNFGEDNELKTKLDRPSKRKTEEIYYNDNLLEMLNLLDVFNYRRHFAE